MTTALIRRQPVVNRQKAITASRVLVHADSAATAVATLNDLAAVWPAGRPIFVGLAGITPDVSLLEWQPPENAMAELPAGALTGPEGIALARELAGRNIPLCLDDYQPGTALPPGLEFRFLLTDAQRFPRMAQAPGLALAKNLENQQAFTAAMDDGYSGASGWFFLHGLPKADKLNPGHAQIVRVLNLVRRNAEVKDIEAALKQDVSLSYKLLRYINSAGFGLSCEIQSFRHAVTILGYDKLNKWLSLLLVTASRDPSAPALMQTAIARGRFMEIIGATFFDKAKLDNLFITGAFSLLDALLGADIAAVLEQMHLPEPVVDALLRREGVFGPFLDLAFAYEGEDIDAIRDKAAALGLTPLQLNRAQLEALAFADSLQLN